MQRVVREDEHCRHILLGGSRWLQSPVAAWPSRLSEENDVTFFSGFARITKNVTIIIYYTSLFKNETDIDVCQMVLCE